MDLLYDAAYKQSDGMGLMGCTLSYALLFRSVPLPDRTIKPFHIDVS